MPRDIMKETDITTYCDQLIEDFNPNVLETIKGIWLESNSENNVYVLQSSESVNSDVTQCQTDYLMKEVHSCGFIVGHELENVKAKSRRSLMQQMSNHISMNFQSLYGKENNGVRQNYFQIGVRVPSKEHVSEIVGKQGLKIKEIREKTGALIITPGESEDHVFIIEATPSIALNVAKFINERACEITNNRVRDNFQKSMTFSTSNRYGYNKPFTTVCTSRPILATGVIEVPKNIVGRIIGTHGSIITTIQKDTGTEIRSPPKENHLANKNNKAKFEILVYQKSNSIDIQEAVQRIKNAKQLIAHVALHQMERIRAEESPFSNYRIKNFTLWENGDGEKSSCERTSLTDKEKLLNYQMQTVAWLWTDIDRLDEQMSEEVVLRILEESKKKSKLRTDFDVGSAAIDRLDENPNTPYKQDGTFSNGYEVPPYSPPAFFDLSPTIKSISPNHLNGTVRESTESPYFPRINYQSMILANSSSLCTTKADVTTNSSTTNGRPKTLNYKGSLLCPPEVPTSKSYAEHLKTLSSSTSIIPPMGPLTHPFPVSNSSNHGAIGDHIKKLNPNQTAQFHKI